MGHYDKGMRLSARGLSVTGQQVVNVNDDIIFVLNDGELSSYRYNSRVDSGFAATSHGSNAAAYAQQFVLSDSKIMEIAGGNSLKLRYDNGVCVILGIQGENAFIPSTKTNVARITENGIYTIPNGNANNTAVPYFKSGPGTADLVPLLSDGTNHDIVAVFEDIDGDKIIRMGDVTSDPVVGYFNGSPVVQGSSGIELVTPGGRISIDGYGVVSRKTFQTMEIFMSKVVAGIREGDSVAVDYSDQFSPAHYSYIQAHREDWENSWHGEGRVGFVVDAGEQVNMKVPCSSPTPALDESIPIVLRNGNAYKVGGDGSLTPVDTVDLDGDALINHIYDNDMSQTLVIGSFGEAEPFCVNGYSFGYPSGRWVDADLSEM